VRALACGVVLALAIHGGAESAGDAAGKTGNAPVYKPPLRGAPAGRVGGGTRGTSERESFSLLALAPDHVGLTATDQPCLYWFISKPIAYPIEVTVIERGAVAPLIEKTLKAPEAGGIVPFRLSDHGVRLRTGAQYKWFVTVVPDADARSKDILAGGIIEFLEAPAALTDKVKAADGPAVAFLYAEEGYWYDALASISGLIDRGGDTRPLRSQRASLLEQVGLTDAATFDARQ